jgi:hypothetical protein
MMRGFAYSQKLLALAGATVGAAFVTALLHHHVFGERIGRRIRAENLEGSLTKQINGMSEFDDSKLDALRAWVGRFRNQLGAEDSWERLVLQFGKDWDAQAGPKDERAGYSFQTGTFLLQSPVPSDWPRIVDAVSAAEQLRGVGIARFEMKASGDREHRTLDLVKIVVEIRASRPQHIP